MVTIVGIQINDRQAEAGKVQGVLTEFGCSIKTRIGVHEATKDFCSPGGLIILEMLDQPEEIKKMEQKLSQIQGITVKKMSF